MQKLGVIAINCEGEFITLYLSWRNQKKRKYQVACVSVMMVGKGIPESIQQTQSLIYKWRKATQNVKWILWNLKEFIFT